MPLYCSTTGQKAHSPCYRPFFKRCRNRGTPLYPSRSWLIKTIMKRLQFKFGALLLLEGSSCCVVCEGSTYQRLPTTQPIRASNQAASELFLIITKYPLQALIGLQEVFIVYRLLCGILTISANQFSKRRSSDNLALVEHSGVESLIRVSILWIIVMTTPFRGGMHKPYKG